MTVPEGKKYIRGVRESGSTYAGVTITTGHAHGAQVGDIVTMYGRPRFRVAKVTATSFVTDRLPWYERFTAREERLIYWAIVTALVVCALAAFDR